MDSSESPLPEKPTTDPSLWLERHGDILYRYALQRIRNRDLAEELVQETLLAALRGHGEFGGRSSERTWLVAILRRKIIDHFRTEATADQGRANDAAQGPACVFNNRGKWRIAPGAWPCDQNVALESDDFWKAFDKCYGQLATPFADAFCLCEMENVETQDACKVLNISASNLWTRLHRARLLLRQCMESNWFRTRNRES